MRRRLVLVLAVSLPALLAGAALPATEAVAARAFTVTASLDPTEVVAGGTAVLSGTVKPVRDAKVAIQRRDAEGWQTLARRPLADDGSFRHTITAEDPGSHRYRAKMPRVGRIDPGRSPAVTLTVLEPEVVEFTIPDGVHSGDWNTPETAVVAEVGQVLRVTNGDIMSHGIETGGHPFADPNTTILPGETEDYLLTSSFDGELACSVHPTSAFWITVTPAGAE